MEIFTSVDPYDLPLECKDSANVSCHGQRECILWTTREYCEFNRCLLLLYTECIGLHDQKCVKVSKASISHVPIMTITTRQNYVINFKNPPSWICHLGVQNCSEMLENQEKRNSSLKRKSHENWKNSAAKHQMWVQSGWHRNVKLRGQIQLTHQNVPPPSPRQSRITGKRLKIE